MASGGQMVFTTSSCQKCRNVDTEEMVQCDKCDLWYHFICVGVTSEISSKYWECDQCKYALPKNPLLDIRDKENRSPERLQWRKTQTSMSSVSSKRSKILALQKLDEERALSEKRDHEYLRQKYSILEDSTDEMDEMGEHRSKEKDFDKTSFENTLQWATDMQNLSRNYATKFTLDDISISLNEEERTTLNCRFNKLAQSSANIQQPNPVVSISHREQNLIAAQRNQQTSSNAKEDSGKISKVGASLLHNTNPFIDLNEFQLNLTEVSSGKPLQSKIVADNVNLCKSSSEGIRHKEFRYNPIQSSKLQVNNQSTVQSQSVFNSGVNEIQQRSIFNSNTYNVPLDKFKIDSRSMNFSQDIKRPKMEFDRFGFSSIKPSSSKVEQFHIGNQPSMEQVRSSNPIISNPYSSNNPNAPTTNNFENFTSNNQNAPTTSNFNNSPLNNSFLIYGPTFDYRKICLSYVQLTANQIASRHTMNKKLPQFYGVPIKWQMFDSAFIHSTITCGLSNSENLSRLSESLKGDAENAVKCRLLHPDSVPGVMETLRLMFGRPELVINALLDEITNTKAPKSDDLGSLVQFAIAVQNLCSTIQFYKSIEHLRNPTLMKALTDKLPSQIQLNWAFYKQRAGDVNVSTLGDWLYELATIASDVVTIDVSANKKARKEGENLKNNKQANYINVQNESKPKSSGVSSKNLKKCPACNKDICKVLAFCEKFKNMSRQERWKLIKSNNLCGCCLGTHRYFNCNQKTPCGIAGCSYFHHVLLHNESKTENPEKQTLQGNDRLKKDCNSMKVIGSKFPELFRIVPVKLFVNGKSMRIFVYLDDGSNLTTLNKALAHKIGLCGSKESLCVKWSFGDTQVEVDSNRVTVQISGVFDGAEIFTLVDVRTVDKLQLPSQSITKSWLSQYSYLKDIPITPYMNAVPQMIIGLNYSKLMVSFDTIEGNWNQPIACRTRLGWTIQGPNDRNISLVASNKFSLNMCECQLSDNNLHHLVKGFFSHESFGVTISDRIIESKEMMRARNILESSTVKNGNHYEAALLWRKTDVTLPHSFDMAMRRLECVESKMKKNPILAERMRIYIKEIMNKGYIRKLNQYEQRNHGSRTWYLPVFPVFNPKKPEKLRLVWDGAAKVKGVSLNSELLAGPDQLVPLPDILRRFREACIGLSTDIIEMFHRVQVNRDDQDSQRFLWRDGDDKKEPEVFVLQVLPFGLTCSPAIAQFVKNKNALEFRQEFPIAVEAITKNHYVDDMIERAHDVESAVKLIKDVQFIHGHANFNLRNLVSNNQQVLEKINGSTEFSDKILAEKLDFNVERILGMYWNTKTDTFTYSLQFVKFNEMTKEYSPTKREVLRIVMSVFDPLGFLAHLLVHAKFLLQEIWRNDIGWDTSLPDLLKQKWFKWLQHLQQVEQLHIPRLYSPRMSPNKPTYIQLHVFVDAIAQAYATSAYFRIEDELGVDSQIVGAKSRVASNKPISIPRLELQGAVLGSRFAESIIKSHYNLNIEKVVFWCDSKTVLFWLDSEPRRYSQFVAFRLGEILDSTINAQWRWIPSEFNVADMATKTKNLPELHSSSVWFVGPEFLRHRNPELSFELDESNFTTDEEVRPLYLLSHLAVPVQKFIEYERFSNWQRLLRATTYVLRFIQNSKLHHQNRNFGIFSSDELLAGENWLFRQVQHDCFSEEILIVRWNLTAPLDKQKDFDKASIIRTCSPFLDEFGVLRVMGRLDNAHSISESAKRPIILARNHHVTHLIVDWYHRKYCHRHHQTVLNEIKQKFWIPKLRMVLNGIRNSCQKCKNSAASPRIPEMGAIPKERLAVFTRPFTFSGVDYFGPIKVIVNRGTQKRWGVLFTCMTTRAIHLEIAHSMDTSSCIMSIRNFECNRGKPRKYFSDNGTNFHGAHNVFCEELANLDHDKIQEEFVTSETSWSFNPPKGAHMGGVWERMVGIVKTCLDEILTIRYPTDEMLKSLFAEVMNIVNSRPLTYVSLESPDDEVLTPNHFLLGSSNGHKPPGTFVDVDLVRNNWRTIQAMSDKFWHKFVDEYLPMLVKRPKWFRKVEPMQVGDVVLLVDSSFQRNTWPKGIIIETFKDKTGQVRSARVRTATGTIFRRPVSHLAVLDVGIQDQVKLNSPNQLTGESMFGSTD